MDIPLAPVPPTVPGPSSASLKARGWVLIVIGLLLSGGIGALTWFLNAFVHRPVPPGGSPRYTGSPQTLTDTFLLLGSLCAFGLVSLFMGVYQVRHGRKSRLLMFLFFLVLAAIIGTGIMATLAAQASRAAAATP